MHTITFRRYSRRTLCRKRKKSCFHREGTAERIRKLVLYESGGCEQTQFNYFVFNSINIGGRNDTCFFSPTKYSEADLLNRKRNKTSGSRGVHRRPAARNTITTSARESIWNIVFDAVGVIELLASG